MSHSIKLFKGLQEEEIQRIFDISIKKNYPKNTILIDEGDQTDSLYIILKGQVKVSINDEEGKEVILAILGEGEYFGEMSLLDKKPRSARVTTREQTELLVVPGTEFENYLTTHDDIISNVLKGLLNRLREADKKIESLALKDVYGRVALLLNQLAKEVDGVKVIEERLTHQEIANMVGSSREMVSRILKELSVGEFITVEKKQITINKKLPISW